MSLQLAQLDIAELALSNAQTTTALHRPPFVMELVSFL